MYEWNLDAVNSVEECDANRREIAAAEGVPRRIKSILKRYCSNKAIAVKARLEGRIQDAMFWENTCDRLYDDLPDKWRTW